MATSNVSLYGYRPEFPHPFPGQGVLEAFGVPFIYYGGDGSRICTSAAAEALLRTERVGRVVETQANDVAKGLCWSHARAPVGHLELVRELTGLPDGIGLAFHVTVSVSGRCGVVVVIRPSAGVDTPALSELGLTVREREVALLIAAGLPTKAIASELGITTHTTRHHTERVFDKLGVHTRAAVAAFLARYPQQVRDVVSPHGHRQNRVALVRSRTLAAKHRPPQSMHTELRCRTSTK
jgi:DNA-binding CsgD family transcriptional regulator